MVQIHSIVIGFVYFALEKFGKTSGRAPYLDLDECLLLELRIECFRVDAWEIGEFASPSSFQGSSPYGDAMLACGVLFGLSRASIGPLASRRKPIPARGPP